MNYVISIVNPKEMKKLVEISRKLEITMGVVFLGHGTAVQSMLDLLGIESNEKRVAVMIVSPGKDTGTDQRRKKTDVYRRTWPRDCGFGAHQEYRRWKDSGIFEPRSAVGKVCSGT